jgi:hypothetical protein
MFMNINRNPVNSVVHRLLFILVQILPGYGCLPGSAQLRTYELWENGNVEIALKVLRRQSTEETERQDIMVSFKWLMSISKISAARALQH